MCSPIGHGLVALALPEARQTGKLKQRTIYFLAIIIAANLPDIDFLFGYITGNPNQFHHQWTHSLSFALLASLAVSTSHWIVKKRWEFRLGFLTFILVVSHLVLDYFSKDSGYPYGIQLFWPITERYYIAPAFLFFDIAKAATQKEFFPSLFCQHNLITVLREIMILLPFAIVVKLIIRLTYFFDRRDR